MSHTVFFWGIKEEIQHFLRRLSYNCTGHRLQRGLGHASGNNSSILRVWQKQAILRGKSQGIPSE